ncbi:transmembrane 220 family protein [Mariniflexile gromovii]|uniref:Transmembrane 220 family protein n=1 Tax=Mariniflexile gromovii TaxID=362523 RepID=A0ABS4BR25_9FLAO|nr:transmembrane 220 family protein [Mariniflexile gromovii]MBP0903034.1 transmembrane 220 family protein [Mariniflexile gromovii]
MIKASLSKSKKITNSVLFILFTLFAVIQLNDPDPMHWFLIYMGVAVISLGSNFITIPKAIIVLIILGLLVYAAMHFMFLIDWLQTENKSEILGEMVYEKPYLEGSREFLGLLIAVGALLYQLKR